MFEDRGKAEKIAQDYLESTTSLATIVYKLGRFAGKAAGRLTGETVKTVVGGVTGVAKGVVEGLSPPLVEMTKGREVVYRGTPGQQPEVDKLNRSQRETVWGMLNVPATATPGGDKKTKQTFNIYLIDPQDPGAKECVYRFNGRQVEVNQVHEALVAALPEILKQMDGINGINPSPAVAPPAPEAEVADRLSTPQRAISLWDLENWKHHAVILNREDKLPAIEEAIEAFKAQTPNAEALPFQVNRDFILKNPEVTSETIAAMDEDKQAYQRQIQEWTAEFESGKDRIIDEAASGKDRSIDLEVHINSPSDPVPVTARSPALEAEMASPGTAKIPAIVFISQEVEKTPMNQRAKNWLQKTVATVSQPAKSLWNDLRTILSPNAVATAQTARMLVDRYGEIDRDNPTVRTFRAEGYDIYQSGKQYRITDKAGQELFSFEDTNLGWREIGRHQMEPHQQQDFLKATAQLAPNNGLPPIGDNIDLQIDRLGNLAPEGSRAFQDDVDRMRVYQIATSLLDGLGIQSGKGQRFETNNYVFERDSKQNISITAKDGRGQILGFERGTLEGQLSRTDLERFRRLDEFISQQKQQNRTTGLTQSYSQNGRGRSRSQAGLEIG